MTILILRMKRAFLVLAHPLDQSEGRDEQFAGLPSLPFTVLIGPAGTTAFSTACNKSFLLQPSIAVPSKAVKAARLLKRSGFVANLGSVPKCPEIDDITKRPKLAVVPTSYNNIPVILGKDLIWDNIWMGIPKPLGRIT